MKQYILNHPDDHDWDITPYVVKGISNINEIAFDLDKVTTPTAGDVVCDNSTGKFVSGQGKPRRKPAGRLVPPKIGVPPRPGKNKTAETRNRSPGKRAENPDSKTAPGRKRFPKK